jgi:hypothetical protein
MRLGEARPLAKGLPQCVTYAHVEDLLELDGVSGNISFGSCQRTCARLPIAGADQRQQKGRRRYGAAPQTCSAVTDQASAADGLVVIGRSDDNGSEKSGPANKQHEDGHASEFVGRLDRGTGTLRRQGASRDDDGRKGGNPER